uniref:Uncharacterized protein n=1 Tax=Spongospora subterranea TaxID=70186 RepID=A0A0H5QF87_9EUKA|eukprot:CRZ00703.1 hypothetical protein [Spongospora subterranea]
MCEKAESPVHFLGIGIKSSGIDPIQLLSGRIFLRAPGAASLSQKCNICIIMESIFFLEIRIIDVVRTGEPGQVEPCGLVVDVLRILVRSAETQVVAINQNDVWN